MKASSLGSDALSPASSTPIDVTITRTRATAQSIATVASQRSCCRSSPVARRNRTTIETTHPNDKGTSARPQMRLMAPKTASSDSMPSGFIGWIPSATSIGPGLNQETSVSTTMSATNAINNHRQRGEGT
jgi:hypothetical protein